MNQINIALTPVQAALVLSALRHVSSSVNWPQLEDIIDNLQAACYADLRDEAELDSEPDQFRTDGEPDQFRTDGEADADALASAGFGTDEDYGGEDRFLDSHWEE
jgi:hypothetical protein